MPVVAMEPVGQLGGALVRGLIGSCVGPFAKRGLDEALGLAVGLRCVGSGEDLAQTEARAGGLERLRPLARTVVCHHAFDAHTELGIVSDGGLQKGNGAFLALVRHDLHESNARAVIDADVDELAQLAQNRASGLDKTIA